MTTMTMPVTAERSQTNHTHVVSQWVPFLLAIALQVAATVVSVLISGPMH